MKFQKKIFLFFNTHWDLFFFFWAVCLLEDLMREILLRFFFSIKVSIIFFLYILFSFVIFSLFFSLSFYFCNFFFLFYCRLSLLFNSLLFSNSGLTFLSCNIPSDSYQILLVVFCLLLLLFSFFFFISFLLCRFFLLFFSI